MQRRKNAEFSKNTMEEVVHLQKSRCEHCKRKLTPEEYTFHHILPLWYAAIFFPDLSCAALKNVLNCQLLCRACHDLEHGQEFPKSKYTPKKHQYREKAEELRKYDKKVNSLSGLKRLLSS